MGDKKKSKHDAGRGKTKEYNKSPDRRSLVTLTRQAVKDKLSK